MQTTDFLGNSWTYDCMGCAIANQSLLVPGGMIQKTAQFCVHQDPLIPLPGFLVIASLRHIQSISQMQADEYAEFTQLVRVTHHAIKLVTQIETLTLVQEESSAHFHFWFFPWTADILQQYGRPSLTRIREIMAEYRQHPLDQTQWAELEKTINNIRTILS